MQNFIGVFVLAKSDRSVEVGCSTAVLCSISNIANELGRPVKWNLLLCHSVMITKLANHRHCYKYRGSYTLPYCEKKIINHFIVKKWVQERFLKTCLWLLPLVLLVGKAGSANAANSVVSNGSAQQHLRSSVSRPYSLGKIFPVISLPFWRRWKLSFIQILNLLDLTTERSVEPDLMEFEDGKHRLEIDKLLSAM